MVPAGVSKIRVRAIGSSATPAGGVVTIAPRVSAGTRVTSGWIAPSSLSNTYSSGPGAYADLEIPVSNLTGRTLQVLIPTDETRTAVRLRVDGTNDAVILGSGGQAGVVQAYSAITSFRDTA